MKKLNIIRPVVGTVLILLIPLVAMQVTDEVNWDEFDFAVAGILLLITGVGLEFVINRFRGSRFRIAAVIAIVAVFLLVWAELAVGVFGTPWAGS